MSKPRTVRLNFYRDRECTACPLHASVEENACIPTRKLYTAPGRSAPDTALLIIGNNPGVAEDREDKHFVGQIGQIVEKAYAAYIVQECKTRIDVYGTNAVRCIPPEGGKVTENQAKKCGDLYLTRDMELLARGYKKVFILACGGPACKQVFGVSLGGVFRKQGSTVKIGETEAIAFGTYNPGMLLPGRDPGLVGPVKEHLLMVAEFIRTGKLDEALSVARHEYPPALHAPRGLKQRIISLDIETYGCTERTLDNRTLPLQTCFHPKRMVALDGVLPRDIIQTCGVSWRDNAGELQHRMYVLPEHDGILSTFLYECVEQGYDFLGQNFGFDVKCLRTIPRYRAIFDRQFMQRHGSRLLELGVARFQARDNAPELSLKELALVLRIYNYDGEKDLRSGFRYTDRNDPELHYYNIADTGTTLLAWEKLKALAAKKYPRVPAKMTEFVVDWYNDCLWSCIELDEAGLCMDRERLQKLQDHLERKMERIYNWINHKHKLKIGGTGSEKPLRRLFREVAESIGLADDSRLESTRVKGISLGKANIHLLIDNMPIGHKSRGILRCREEYKAASKIISHYTRPLLEQPDRGIVGDSMAWPSWFVVPGRISDDAGSIGGTKQGRVTCHNPPLQTFSRAVRACKKSRFEPGVLIHADYSQLELRIMALLSGDPEMLKEFEQNLDNHSITALLFLGELLKIMEARSADSLYGANYNDVRAVLDAADGQAITKPFVASSVAPLLSNWDQWRHCAKTANFLRGYKGGANTLQAMIRNQMRLELDIDICQRVIYAGESKYSGLAAWQEERIRYACENKYVDVPLIGDTRTFGGSKQAIRDTYTTNIVNFDVQYLAAAVNKQAQRRASDRYQELGMEALIYENCYDAIETDAPSHEEEAAYGVISYAMTDPPFFEMLCEHYGRRVPLDHEIETTYRTVEYAI